MPVLTPEQVAASGRVRARLAVLAAAASVSLAMWVTTAFVMLIAAARR